MEGIYLFLPVRDLNGFSALPEGNQMKSQASAAAEYPKPASIWRKDRSFPCKIYFILFFFTSQGLNIEEKSQSAWL